MEDVSDKITDRPKPQPRFFDLVVNRLQAIGLSLLAGFFVGNRGPVRPKGQGPSLFGARFMRWATPLEREESLNESALYVVVGFLLIVLGVAADSRYRLI